MDFKAFDILIPFVAFTGKSIDITYSVVNIGNLTSSSTDWYDYLYISTVNSFKSASYLGFTYQNRILFPNDSYTDTIRATLSDSHIGKYYFFIQTSIYNDFDFSNNVLGSSNAVEIKLTPPANLIVSSIIIPSSSFSGSEIRVKFLIKNIGLSHTRSSYWYDQIMFNNLKYNSTLKVITHDGVLQPGDSYEVTQNVFLPNAIFGNFSIVIQTDVNNLVYEFVYEDDNFLSEPIRVQLSPPPDLVVADLSTNLAVKSLDTLDISFTVKNIGNGAPFETFWVDCIQLFSFDNLLKSQ